jgi:hypothetical protein
MDCEMTFSTHTLLRFAAKLTRCLSLVLLPALASEARALSAPQRKTYIGAPAGAKSTSASSASTPYLTVLGSLPLRFARPRLEATDEPPLAPVPKVEETADEKPVEPKAPELAPKPANEQKPAEEAPVEQPVSTPEPAAGPPLPILPDDTKRELRAEDVLLYFRYPNSSSSDGGTATHVIVPAPSSQPQSAPIPSSATYQQK